MGARKVWQMFPSVILSHDFTSTLFFFFFSSIKEGQRKCSVSLVLSNYSALGSGCVTLGTRILDELIWAKQKTSRR